MQDNVTPQNYTPLDVEKLLKTHKNPWKNIVVTALALGVMGIVLALFQLYREAPTRQRPSAQVAITPALFPTLSPQQKIKLNKLAYATYSGYLDVQPKNCKGNMECLLAAAQSCTRAYTATPLHGEKYESFFTRGKDSVELLNINATLVRLIDGEYDGVCKYVEYFTNVTFSYGGKGTPEAQLLRDREKFEERFAEKMLCLTATGELAQYITALESGAFTPLPLAEEGRVGEELNNLRRSYQADDLRHKIGCMPVTIMVGLPKLP